LPKDVEVPSTQSDRWEKRLRILYQNTRKPIILHLETLLVDFKDFSRKEFKIGSKDIKFSDIKRNIEITPMRSFKEEHKIAIFPTGDEENIL